MALIPPPKTVVELPLGIYDYAEGKVIDDAEVRELNGWDEEFILRGNSHKLLSILERGVSSVGGAPPTKETLNKLHMCDRMELLLAIRSVTWGDLEWDNITCENCGEVNARITLADADIPRDTVPDKKNDRTFEVETGLGMAQVNFPSGEYHRKILGDKTSNSGELNTALLTDCLVSITDRDELFGEKLARSLSLRDRNAILLEIYRRTPGPRMNAVTAPCEHCNERFAFPLVLGALFPL